MDSYQERLDILSEMIAFARVDNSLKDSEHHFLLTVAAQLGVDKDAFEELLQKKASKPSLKSQPDRIVQFHRLVLLMNVDQEQHAKEMYRLRNIGLKMGLPPAATEQVLRIMHNYPNKVV
ncbi:MAG: TerB family tellurite resistance protein, partial [Bacteroidota bacterium]